ncbi:AAA family ATPase (plasmid) [Rhodococcus pseudokoreensis]|uniref:AAA family ATPase n=1 Tax=Rhodococcus pseudokoreensis TaxID=2811421 RepID=A0A974VYE2_9NOCA|nr:FtsK/SpoIIIE domain-containing protein [Rhodococcus pseudokoreensis]QSE87878.1 AAA family ATPase [Rhodococcus pseudokoreensis]
MTTDDSVADLARLGDELPLAHQRVLGSLEAATRRHEQATAARAQAMRADQQRAVALARNRSAQQVIEFGGYVRDNTETATNSAVDDVLATAEYVQLGHLELPGHALGVNEDLELPWVVPLLGRSNLVVFGGDDQARSIVHRVVLAALTGTAPGQLDVIGHDPHLRGWLAPFSGLKDALDGSLYVVSSADDLDKTLDRLIADVQRVTDTMRGSEPTLLDYRRTVGYPAERLQLVVLLDYPIGVTDTMHRKVTTLARVGPAAGICLVVVSGNDTRGGSEGAPQPDRARELHDFGEIIDQRSALRWSRYPHCSAHLSAPTVDEVIKAVADLTARMRTAGGPQVDFVDVEDLNDRWTRSSAEGITFALGRAGRDLVEVRFGDEREQRHNALVTGAVGQGKSNLLKVIIHSLSQRYSPAEVQMYLLDFKDGVSLYPYTSTPHSPDFLPHARVLGLESDRDFGLAVLQEIDAERVRRAAVIKPYGDNIARYRHQVPAATMPRIVLMIDEFQRLFEPGDDAIAGQAAQLLEGLARLGRAYGIHVLLASQSISGISALMARESGLYGQFPIRIGLKNSPQESVATMSVGNDGPARLRHRGEAVINLDYGSLGANRTVTIASAQDDILDSLRHTWWELARDTCPAPAVFDGARLLRPADAVPSIRRLRAARLTAQSGAPSAVIGMPISVSAVPATVTFTAEPGRNLAVLGAGEKLDQLGAAPGETAANHAIGVLQTAALSLALQHPAGDARFVSIELLDDSTASRNNMGPWHHLMARIGFPVDIIDRNGILNFLQEQADAIAEADPAGPATYILAFGLDRIGRLDTPDAFANTPAEVLRAVLRDGPTKSVHVLGWWANTATYQAHLGFAGDGMVDVMVFLRVDQSAVHDFLGPFVTWTVRDNRALWTDRTQLPEPTVLVPFSPVGDQDARVITTAEWGP